MTQSYQDIQRRAKGPGTEEWKSADKARADLAAYYQQLQEDPRITDLARSEQAWERYQTVKARVEAESARAKELSERSARTAERQSLPMPEGEAVVTDDKDRLLLTQGEHARINRRIDRASNRATDATPFSLSKLLREEFARGLEAGGAKGGAICRAVAEIAQDAGEDIHSIVDEHRKPYQRQALQDAQDARMRQQLIGKTVSKPPFPPPEEVQQGGKEVGTYRRKQIAFMPTDGRVAFTKALQGNRRRRPHWK